MTRRARLAALVIALVLVASCSSSGGTSSSETPSSSDSTVAKTLRGFVSGTLVSGHQELAAAATKLQTTLQGCDARVADARDAWRQTRLAWDKVAPFAFGAQTQRLLPSQVDYWPVKTDEIDAFAAATGDVTPTDVGALGSGARGLPALERLLFSTTPLAGRRCAYAQQLTKDIAEGAANVASDWQHDADVFAKYNRALADVVSALADAAYRIADDQLAMPAGVRAGTTPNPALLHGREGGMALIDAKTQLESIRAAYAAAVAPILAARGPDADASMNAALAAAAQALNLITGDLATAITAQRDVVLAASEACRVVRYTFATQVAGALGITLNVPAGDGD